MNKEYKIKKRCLFKPGEAKPFRISRSQIDRFVECPRCFYIDHCLGMRRPDMPGWPINSLADRMLKKEFDVHRTDATAHPIMTQYGLDAVPFQHPMIDEWRENFKGMTWLDARTNLLVTGAIDDIWIDRGSGRLIVVDYKATAKKSEEITLEHTKSGDEWKTGYRRQMEVYIWLLRKQGLRVDDRGFFLYANGRDGEGFNEKIEFELSLLPHAGACDWIEPVLLKIKACLMHSAVPAAPVDCEYCGYAKAAGGLS